MDENMTIYKTLIASLKGRVEQGDDHKSAMTLEAVLRCELLKAQIDDHRNVIAVRDADAKRLQAESDTRIAHIEAERVRFAEHHGQTMGAMGRVIALLEQLVAKGG